MKAIEIKITIPFDEFKNSWMYNKLGNEKTVEWFINSIEQTLKDEEVVTKFEIEGYETET